MVLCCGGIGSVAVGRTMGTSDSSAAAGGGGGGMLTVETAAAVLATVDVHSGGGWLHDEVHAFVRRNLAAVVKTEGWRLLRERLPRLAQEFVGADEQSGGTSVVADSSGGPVEREQGGDDDEGEWSVVGPRGGGRREKKNKQKKGGGGRHGTSRKAS
jgi:hypothetical protein